MRFEMAHSRWKKMVRGHRYVVTCEELGAPRTRDGSRQAANEWFEAKLREDQLKAETIVVCNQEEEERARQVAYLDRKIAFAREKVPEEVEGLERARLRLLRGWVVDGDSVDGPEVDQPDKNEEADAAALRSALELCNIDIPPGMLEHIHKMVSGREAVWADRLQNYRPTPDKFKIGNFLEDFLKEARLKEKPSTAGELRKYLNLFIREAGIWTRDSDIRSVNSETVKKFISWLFSKKYTPATHNKAVWFFRRFIKSAWEEDGGLESLPRKLMQDSHLQLLKPKKVKQFNNIIKQTNHLPLKFRYWVLLALNCGCSNADLGNLTWDMIDIRTWRLTRKRVKTETTDPKSPEVIYKLWPETIRMLKTFPNRRGLIFQTKTGEPMYFCRFVGERTVTKDLFASYWQRLKNNKPSFSLGNIRSIGSSIIENEPSHKYVQKHSILYNGRMPNSIDERSYLCNRLTFLDEPLDCLRKELGVEKLKLGVS